MPELLNVCNLLPCRNFCRGLVGKMPNVAMVEQAGGDLDLKGVFTKPGRNRTFYRINRGRCTGRLSFKDGTWYDCRQSRSLDFVHLTKLHQAAGCALVMHGSSGVEPSQLQESDYIWSHPK